MKNTPKRKPGATKRRDLTGTKHFRIVHYYKRTNQLKQCATADEVEAFLNNRKFVSKGPHLAELLMVDTDGTETRVCFYENSDTAKKLR